MSEAVKSKKGVKGEPKKGGNFLKLLIVVLLVLILVGGAAFAGYYFASKNNTGSSGETTKVVVAPVKEAYLVIVEGKLVNLADTDAKRYAKMTMTLAYDSKNTKLGTELTEKKTVIVDAILSTIRNKKAADFDGKGADDVKKELITRINSLLEYGRLTNIYFDEILTQ
jgi:flagellar basal body-associated protein FliL